MEHQATLKSEHRSDFQFCRQAEALPGTRTGIVIYVTIYDDREKRECAIFAPISQSHQFGFLIS